MEEYNHAVGMRIAKRCIFVEIIIINVQPYVEENQERVSE